MRGRAADRPDVLQFHCPCHSLYDKHTALKKRGPAPRGLDRFHMQETSGALVVGTNPLRVMRRDDDPWHPVRVRHPLTCPLARRRVLGTAPQPLGVLPLAPRAAEA